MKFKITLTAKLPIQVTKKETWYLASCPALDVASQDETEEVARKNISEALTMFLRSCVERGTLDAVLRECGFKSVVAQDQDSESESSTASEYVEIPLHLLSQFEESRQCQHA